VNNCEHLAEQLPSPQFLISATIKHTYLIRIPPKRHIHRGQL